ncbi:MAG: glycolate oxidase subunit GlcE, partial [Chromatiaceae bacterium]
PAAAAQLVEWNGALRWLRGDAPAGALRAWARAAGGHATLFRAGAAGIPADGISTPPDPVVLGLHRRLKQAFDPDRLFNPGRLFPDL